MLTKVYLEEGIEVISGIAFSECNNLKEIVIPKSVKSIESKPIYDCNSIETIYYRGTEDDWSQIKISDKYPIFDTLNMVYNYNE